MIEVGRYPARDQKRRGKGKPETFKFLGFTHHCGRRHKSETFTVWRLTAKKRMVAKLKAIKAELRRRSIIASAKSGHGSGRSSQITTNTTLSPASSIVCGPSAWA